MADQPGSLSTSRLWSVTRSLSRFRRFAAAVLLVLVGGSWGVVATAPPVAACSCVGWTDEQALSSADAVFLGEVVERREEKKKAFWSSEDPATYVVRVSRVYKGEVWATSEVVTAVSGASCGLELPSRGTALFFAEGAPPALSASLCNGTREATAAPAAFGPGRLPAAAPVGDDRPGSAAPASGSATLELVLAGAGLLALALAWLRRRRPV